MPKHIKYPKKHIKNLKKEAKKVKVPVIKETNLTDRMAEYCQFDTVLLKKKSAKEITDIYNDIIQARRDIEEYQQKEEVFDESLKYKKEKVEAIKNFLKLNEAPESLQQIRKKMNNPDLLENIIEGRISNLINLFEASTKYALRCRDVEDSLIMGNTDSDAELVENENVDEVQNNPVHIVLPCIPDTKNLAELITYFDSEFDKYICIRQSVQNNLSILAEKRKFITALTKSRSIFNRNLTIYSLYKMDRDRFNNVNTNTISKMHTAAKAFRTEKENELFDAERCLAIYEDDNGVFSNEKWNDKWKLKKGNGHLSEAKIKEKLFSLLLKTSLSCGKEADGDIENLDNED